MHCPRILVSALSGGGGKTLLSLGIGRALTRQGLVVKPYKKGPDYIDAAWLTRACGRSATNLDLFFLDASQIQALFASSSRNSELSLVEGNRGLFDGLDLEGSCSTAALARILSCPVILSVNCSKVTRTVAALIQGMCSFEQGVTIAGVVLNAVGSARHARQVRVALEHYTDVPVLGALPRLAENPLPERHMGIASQGGSLAVNADTILDSLADLVQEHVDIPAVMDIACSAAELSPVSTQETCATLAYGSGRPRIGYVRDDAFWFYYADNLQMLENAGAELVALSLVGTPSKFEDWQNLHGLYLGGGFPEDHAATIASSPVLGLIKNAALVGMPIYAECGGFMLLASQLLVQGQQYPMANLFPVTVAWGTRPQGLGYVEGTVIKENAFFPVGMSLRGHEFHYSKALDCGPCAMRLDRGTGMGEGRDGLVLHNVWASYTHIFAPAVPVWAPNFVSAACHFLRTGKSYKAHSPA